MPQVIQKIFNGKLNLDTHPYRMPPGDYIDALNITRDGEGESKENIVSNLKGNTLIPYTLPAGTNKCIGRYEDKVRNRIYYFIWNNNGNHVILYYNAGNNSTIKLLQSKTDSSGVDILGLNPSWRINHIDIIYRDEGDLMFWTDGLNRPFFINVADAEAALYGTAWLLEYITAARPMPLVPPVGVYANDSAYNINNLVKKVYEFRYRWVYRNFEKSTWSPYSKIPSPVNPDDIAIETDPTKNNRIDIRVTTGRTDVEKIEIAGRTILTPNVFSDDFLIVSLDKSELVISDNSNYVYSFYNDGSYSFVNPLESVLPFDFIPRKAYTQALPNGDVPAYSALTEGYNKEVTMNVTSTVTTYDNADAASLTYYDQLVGRNYEAFFMGSPNTGDQIHIHVDGDDGTFKDYIYITLAGDDATDVRDALVVLANAGGGGYSGSNRTDVSGNPGIRVTHTGLVFVTGTTTITYSGTPAIPPDEIGISTYRPLSRYKFGLVYFDRYGVNPGVITQDTMAIVTAEVDTTGQAEPKITSINFEINHQPPSWAYYYCFVRTLNLTASSNMYLVTQNTLKDSGTPQFAYFNISNIQTNDNDLPTYEFLKGDRLRMVKAAYSAAFTGVKDFPIIDLLINPEINGLTQDGTWVKVPYTADMVNFGTAGSEHWWVEIYTPALNLSDNQLPFFEFGEFYEIGDPTLSTRYHYGQAQNQVTGTQPAKFQLSRGDFYLRQRKNSITSDPSVAVSYWVFDQSISDKFESKIAGNGRPNVIDESAKETYFPTMIRFGGAYQSGTNINETNRFYPDSFDEYDRGYGDVRKLFINKRYLYVFQRFNIGIVPIFTQIIKDTSGNPLEANSDILLNKIAYPYQGGYGIGDVPESFAFGKGAKYFIDSNRGVACRLSQDGITPLSILYECNGFFVSKLAAYGKGLDNGIVPGGQVFAGNPTVHGVFDGHTNKYIVAFEEINRYSDPSTLTFHQDAYTMSFNETRDSAEGFESPYSFKPEMMACLNNLIFSYKNGAMWRHDSDTYANFYGVQYDVYIKAVFNDNILEKKTFTALAEIANARWDCPEIETDLMSFGSSPQQSSLMNGEFEKLEGQFHSSFRRDSNSRGGKTNGSSLKGKYIIIKFKSADPSIFTFINVASVKYISSPLSI